MFRMLKEPFSFLFFSILFYFVNTRLRGTYLAHKAKLAQGMPHSRPKRWLADRLPYGTRSLLRSIFAQPLFDTPAGLGPQGGPYVVCPRPLTSAQWLRPDGRALASVSLWAEISAGNEAGGDYGQSPSSDGDRAAIQCDGGCPPSLPSRLIGLAFLIASHGPWLLLPPPNLRSIARANSSGPKADAYHHGHSQPAWPYNKPPRQGWKRGGTAEGSGATPPPSRVDRWMAGLMPNSYREGGSQPGEVASGFVLVLTYVKQRLTSLSAGVGPRDHCGRHPAYGQGAPEPGRWSPTHCVGRQIWAKGFPIK
jgi:hypothetical protein